MESSNNNLDYNDFIKGTGKKLIEDNDYLINECESLLQSSNYDDDTISDIEKEIWQYEEEELTRLKAMLLMNQTDRIEAGHNYSQTDIKRKLKNI